MRNFNKKIFLVGFLLFFNLISWSVVFDLSKPQILEVVFFDVGQGDAIFIQTPKQHQILIDGGPSSIILEKLGKEMPFWDKTIDLIVLTHPHDDHLLGLINVLENYEVENILWTGAIEDSSAFQKWESIILESGANIIISQAGQRIEGGNFFLDVLYPFVNLEGIEFKDTNLSSIVLRLVFGENTFLFMGDAYKSMEKELIAKEIFCQENNDSLCQIMVLDSDALKVGHHGSKNSSDPEFIEVVSPQIAVIQCGKDNPHGHPHQETLDTLTKYVINILRTDQRGDIKIISDAKNIKIK